MAWWRHMIDKEQAWQWMKFLASSDCENVVESSAIVFPAIPQGVGMAVATRQQQNIDVSAFTSYVDANRTLLFPITSKAGQIQLLVEPVMEKILLGQADPAKALPSVNDDVNQLLKHK
jgi:multiple sugar transport system substrate-binding protein